LTIPYKVIDRRAESQKIIVDEDDESDFSEGSESYRQSPDLKDVIIIASSASVFESNQKDSITAGCNDFLSKPVRADHFFEKLGTRLGLE